MVEVFKHILALSLATCVSADLRMSSQPRLGYGYELRDQGTTPWNLHPWKGQMHFRYMEPSTFGYQGLENQKKRNYDNFLRSNIDNEQDNRNFNDEDGKDHLPFRTYEAVVDDTYIRHSHSRRRNIKQIPQEIPLEKLVKPGESMVVPLRWNNPHASEMEVNIWIFDANKHPIVVPIRKPSCSGEGHQDNVVSFTVPKDFSNLGSKIPGFKGCNKDSKPMCTLQIYSHSVESRTYAIGFPIVIPDHDTKVKSTDWDGVDKASPDPWLELAGLRELCLPATDSSANIPSAKPRWAKLVSDVFNHAYQNSDYSPYSGQQHESISRNLQASAVNKMEVGNRGELGKSILTSEASKRLKYLRGLENRVYKNYEALANKVIKSIEGKVKSTGAIGIQKLADCFRCSETGSTNTNRQQTNTYIPSFKLPTNYVSAARKLVGTKYASLITKSGVVQIYVAAFNDLKPFYYKSRNLGLIYQDAIVKKTSGTMPDATNFKKRDASGKVDGGKYAATEAKKQFLVERGCPAHCFSSSKFAVSKAKYKLLKANNECKSSDKNMGNKNSVQECASAVAADGGRFFIYGKGSKSKKCYTEYTKSESCPDGFDTDSYDFYGIETGDVKKESKALPFKKLAGRSCNGRNELLSQTGITLDQAKTWCSEKADCVSFEKTNIAGKFQFSTSCGPDTLSSTIDKKWDLYVKEKEAPKYVFASPSATSCPSGYEVLADLAECKAGLTINGKDYGYSKSGCSNNRWPASGCFVYTGGTNAYFSTCPSSSSGRAFFPDPKHVPVCKQASTPAAGDGQAMCTGSFYESSGGNGRGRPPANTPCMGACVEQSGRWGNNYCWTEPVGTSKRQWGAPCQTCQGGSTDSGKEVAPSTWAPSAGARMGGRWIRGEKPITLKLDLGNNMWLVGIVDGKWLKMILLQVTGEKSYKWIRSMYRTNTASCNTQTVFHRDCFIGRSANREDGYKVMGDYTKNDSAAKAYLAKTVGSDKWYCVAKLNHNEVKGPFTDLQAAKQELNDSTASSKNRRQICEMSKDGPKADTHWVGGEFQGGGSKLGFQVYWHGGYRDISNMNNMCNKNDMCRLQGRMPAPDPKAWFCVPRAHKKTVSGPFKTVSEAQAELNKQEGSRSNFQMICEMTKDGPKKDPHHVGGLNQGANKVNGFNTYWHSWTYINRMNQQCAANVACNFNTPADEIEGPLFAGSKATSVSGECNQCLQFFGKKVHPMKKPKVTPLAREVTQNGKAPANVASRDRIADNPNLFQKEQGLRAKDMKKKKKKQKRKDLKMVGKFLEHATGSLDYFEDLLGLDTLDDVPPLDEL